MRSLHVSAFHSLAQVEMRIAEIGGDRLSNAIWNALLGDVETELADDEF
jgi:hypothetical protein